MNIAFYAPLKAPTATTPSGDRLIARMLIRMLSGLGHNVELVNSFRSYDGKGNKGRQDRLKHLGERLADRVIRRFENKKPDLWFTYHLYHKAPDWIGPKVARKLGLPYVVAEASFAPKQENGPWAGGHAAVRDALGDARLVVGLTEPDRACVDPCLSADARYLQLPPFLDTSPYAKAVVDREAHRRDLMEKRGLAPNIPRLLTVAMMRPGDKTESYKILANALMLLADREWQLLVVGGGATRASVESFFAPLTDRVVWLGQQEGDDLIRLYAASDVFVWPAVKETPGMCFLEAGAAALPVVGGNGFGVPDVVIDGHTGLLAEHLNVTDFADKIAALLDNRDARRDMGVRALEYIQKHHDIAVAGEKLNAALTELIR